MPGAVRLQLDRAIADHLRAYGSRYYDLLRDDPMFAAWLGTHLGARGEKRLDRAIAAVRRVQKKKPARHLPPMVQGADVEGDAVSYGAADHIGDPAERFAAAGSAVVSYDELQGDLRRRRWQLEREMRACQIEGGGIVDPGLYLKLSREHRALVTDSASLAKRFHADAHSQAVLERVLDRMLNEHAEEPERARAIIADISNIFRETTGIAATGGGA
jgi:hypothetical protein